MIVRRPFAALLIALAIAACSKNGDTPAATGASLPGGPVAAVAPPAGRSWADVIQATPQDGMRMGNPDAPIKLVEYASFTCPHCKLFEDEGSDALAQKYIATGKVSWEFRSTLIHSPDAPITLLMNCHGPDAFFKLSQQLFATQEAWFGKLIAMPADQQQKLAALPPVENFKATIDAMGLYGFFAARGLPRAKADACLADPRTIDRMTATQQRYSTQDNVTGTPTFFLNGQPQADLSTWETVDKKLASLTR